MIKQEAKRHAKGIAFITWDTAAKVLAKYLETAITGEDAYKIAVELEEKQWIKFEMDNLRYGMAWYGKIKILKLLET